MIRNKYKIFGEANDANTVLASGTLTSNKPMTGAGNKGAQVFNGIGNSILTLNGNGELSEFSHNTAGRIIGTDGVGALTLLAKPSLDVLWSGKITATDSASSETAVLSEALSADDILIGEFEMTGELFTGRFYKFLSTDTMNTIREVSTESGSYIAVASSLMSLSSSGFTLGQTSTIRTDGNSGSTTLYCYKIYRLTLPVNGTNVAFTKKVYNNSITVNAIMNGNTYTDSFVAAKSGTIKFTVNSSSYNLIVDSINTDGTYTVTNGNNVGEKIITYSNATRLSVSLSAGMYF